MRYNVITANNMQDETLGIMNFPSIGNKGLISLVNDKLTEGWRPQGGVRRTTDDKGNPLFLQAFTSKFPMSNLLKKIPVAVILDTETPLIGAAIAAQTLHAQPSGRSS